MVDYYYTNAIMGERPDFILPNKEFLEELALIKKRNGSYFMMMCGADERYISKYGGNFDQIKTHEKFSIPNKARIEWLGCWEEVLRQTEDKVEHQHIQSYWNWLETFSKHIVNYENDRETLEDKVTINNKK